MGHACEWETSMILRLAPQLVVGDVKAVPDVPFGRAFEPAHRAWVMPDRSVPGHIGYPRHATAEKGEGLFQSFAEGRDRAARPRRRLGRPGVGRMTAARGRSWKWWTCGVLLLATMLLYMDRLTLAVTATQLKTLIKLDDARYGRLEEWFSYAFAFGGILFGFVADRVGPRRLYPVVLVGWSAAGLLTPLAVWPAVAAGLGDPGDPGSGEFRWLLACRTLLGFFEAGHWPCALIAARNILSADDRPLGNSILQSGASLGAVLTPLVVEGFRLAGRPVADAVRGDRGRRPALGPLGRRLTRGSAVDARPEPAPDCPTGPGRTPGARRASVPAVGRDRHHDQPVVAVPPGVAAEVPEGAPRVLGVRGQPVRVRLLPGRRRWLPGLRGRGQLAQPVAGPGPPRPARQLYRVRRPRGPVDRRAGHGAGPVAVARPAGRRGRGPGRRTHSTTPSRRSCRPGTWACCRGSCRPRRGSPWAICRGRWGPTSSGPGRTTCRSWSRARPVGRSRCDDCLGRRCPPDWSARS